jgi:diketogulonate reductase-like aldo/keto reductase
MKDEGRRALLKAMLATSAGLVAKRLFASPERGSMLTRKIPSSGEEIPVVGVGTSGAFEVGESAAERAPIEEVVRALVAGGGRLVDTSPMYGTAEGVVGDVADKLGLSGKLFLATKVWTTGRAEGIRQMEESFARLKTKRIDLMQVHNLVDWRTQLATVRAWKAQGRIRYAGITHYRVDAHDQLESVMKEEPLDFVQLNYSAVTRDAEKRLLPLAADRGVAVLVNRPFEDGAIFTRVRGRALPPWAAEIGCDSWAQILLKYVLAHPAVTCVIPATAKAAHMRDDLAGGTGMLPDQALRTKIVEAVAAS